MLSDFRLLLETWGYIKCHEFHNFSASREGNEQKQMNDNTNENVAYPSTRNNDTLSPYSFLGDGLDWIGWMDTI